ncbi:hypothetical protein BU23DRAFT_585559 [Bimuria novae-zelandiae CBS 107.79]|uniref:Enoyl reductase (ER) domain-containing protein n=1 Tax=Bimuria novae-zelandiae CBS 107.79 TaxID=1447943 RepID=A0A6A5UKI7_9PLEO|nr:hypothetical protein BU23DRAFT_585559 [Bimuria novae-zelandiae CBS 107.79]
MAQNPTDIQSFDTNALGDGSVFGCDFAGVVEEVGEKVKIVETGDVMARLIWGGLGAYAKYTLADERICFKIPRGITPAAAATVPLATGTAWLALFSSGCLNIDRNRKGTTVLLARTQGLTVFTTCSQRNFDLVKTVDAQSAFDYTDADVAEKIRKVAPDLTYVFDTIDNVESSAIASQAIRDEGSVLCRVRPGKANTVKCTARTKVTDVLVWTAFLKEHAYGEFK